MKGKLTIRSQRGYSLIEVVVAVAIAGIALTMLLQAVQGNAERTALSREYVLATAFGESMLARVGRDLSMETGTRSGRFREAFNWTRTIRPYVDPPQTGEESDVAVSPYEVVVTISWRSGGKSHDLSLRSLRLKASRIDAG